VLALLAAMLARAAIPAGWMPAGYGIAGAPLVICTSSGVSHQPAGGDQPLRSHARHDVCAFSSLASAPPPPLAATVPPSRVAESARVEAAVAVLRRAALTHREQSARAPPALQA